MAASIPMNVCPCCEAPGDLAIDEQTRYMLCSEHAALYPYPLRLALTDANSDEAVAKWLVLEDHADVVVFHHAYHDVDDWIELHNLATDVVRFVRVSSILRCGIKEQ